MSGKKRNRISRAEKRKIANRMPPEELEEDVLRIIQDSECEIIKNKNGHNSVVIRPPFRHKAVVLADDEAYSRHGGNENDSCEINWSRSGTESNISN